MPKKAPKKIGVRIVFAWIFSILFLLAGFGAFTMSAVASGLLYLIAGLILFPPLNIILKEKANIVITAWLKIVIVIILLVIASSLLPNPTFNSTENNSPLVDTDANDNTPQNPTPESSQKIYSLGEKVPVDDFVYTFTNYETTNYVGGEYFGNDANGIFVIFDLAVENQGAEADYINNEIYIIDDQGREFSQDDSSWVYLDDNFIFEELNPGLTKRGQIIFDVPENIKGKLCIKKSMFSDECVNYISWN